VVGNLSDKNMISSSVGKGRHNLDLYNNNQPQEGFLLSKISKKSLNNPDLKEGTLDKIDVTKIQNEMHSADIVKPEDLPKKNWDEKIRDINSKIFDMVWRDQNSNRVGQELSLVALEQRNDQLKSVILSSIKDYVTHLSYDQKGDMVVKIDHNLIGKMDLNIHFSDNGKMNIHIQMENDQIKNLLELHRGDLKDHLSSQGFQVKDIFLSETNRQPENGYNKLEASQTTTHDFLQKNDYLENQRGDQKRQKAWEIYSNRYLS
jgi:flagellar hook-length control protein FliK